MPLGPLQPPLELTSDAEHDFRLLLRFVTKREGFHFGLAVTDDERVRNRLVERLGKEAAALGVDVLTVDLRALP